MFSYWEQQTFLSGIDVAVIGSGIVGLSAALALKKLEPSLNIAVFERGMLPSGASTKNAGFACFGSISELLMDLETQSEEAVFGLVEKRFKGLLRLRENVGDVSLRLEQLGGYELFDDDVFYERCADRIPWFNQQLKSVIGQEVYRPADHRISEFGFGGIRHLIFNAYEGQVHTGGMMAALLDRVRTVGVSVFNGAFINKLVPDETGVTLTLAEGQIRVPKVLVATNGFARQLMPELDVTPGRGQVLVTSQIPNLPIRGTFHYDKGYVYFRNIDGRVLLGGGRNLNFSGEATTEFGLTDQIQNRLESLLRTTILPRQTYTIESRWSGVMGFGKQQEPIVKVVAPNVVCAVKMQGMGVALGSMTGEQGAALLLSN